MIRQIFEQMNLQQIMWPSGGDIDALQSQRSAF